MSTLSEVLAERRKSHGSLHEPDHSINPEAALGSEIRPGDYIVWKDRVQHVYTRSQLGVIVTLGLNLKGNNIERILINQDMPIMRTFCGPLSR